MTEQGTRGEALGEAIKALRTTEAASPMVELMGAMAQVAIAEQLGRIADAIDEANRLNMAGLEQSGWVFEPGKNGWLNTGVSALTSMPRTEDDPIVEA